MTIAVVEQTITTLSRPRWSGAGTTLKDCKNVKEAIEQGNLSWRVDLREIQTAELNPILFTDNFGIIRIGQNGNKDIPLGVVGNKYSPIQNVDCASIADAILESEDNVTIEKCGTIFNGKRVWLALKLGSLEVGTRKILRCIMISWSHDGSLSLRGDFIPILESNSAMLKTEMKGTTNNVAIKHTLKADDRIKEGKKVLERASSFFGKIEKKFQLMVNMPFDNIKFLSLAEALFPTDADGIVSTRKRNMRGDLLNIYTSPELDDIRDTKFGAFCAVASYATHDKSSRTSEGKDANEVRLNALCFGQGSKITGEAFNWLDNMA